MTNDTRTMPEHDSDLRLLLAEADREDPILSAPRDPDRERDGEEELDEQILAGLVTP